MICISINQESRRLALVDMLNASRQCDLLEVRLDRFGKAPEIAELLARKPKPVIMSCRRKEDGGHWDGSEDERLAILRQCIIGKADYVEIELDVADQIRKFPPSLRVISFVVQPLDDADEILQRYQEAQTKHPEIIKITTTARTPEEAWPVIKILARPPVPTVVCGMGKPGVMLTVLGKKIGAPWTYAALEKGMEAYPAQPTVHELREVYHYDRISKSTRLIGVTGFDEQAYYTTAALNAALAHFELSARCLPLGVGDVATFRRIVDAVKLAGVVVDEAHQEKLLELAEELHATAAHARAVNLVLPKNEKWHGYHTVSQAVVNALSGAYQAREASTEPLSRRLVLIVGVTPTARILAAQLAKNGASIIIASRSRKAAQELAAAVKGRHILFDAIYTTMHEICLVCDEEKELGGGGIHPGFLKPNMLVADLTAKLTRTPLLQEAVQRGALILEPRELFLELLEQQARLLTGKETPREVLERVLPEAEEEEVV